jgi:uncharacterized membrane protein YcaP (DUF421 family)
MNGYGQYGGALMPEYVVVIIRTIFSFVLLLLFARILGKKQIAQLTFFDYIAGITMGNIAATLAINPALQIINATIGLVLYTLLTIVIGLGAIKSFRFRQLVEGSSSTLIRNGNILEDNLAKVKMSYEDLIMGLRQKNAFKVADVEEAILETNGKISVMKKAEYSPLTPKDAGIMVEAEQMPSLIIIDGQLLEKRLHYLGYTKEWLLGEVLAKGAKDITDVFLAQIDSTGNVYADLYHENEKIQQAKQKPLLAAKLRKMQADLEGFAIQTNDPNAKQMYYNQSIELQDLINKINPYLRE